MPGPVFGAFVPIPGLPIRAPWFICAPVVAPRELPALLDDAANAGIAPRSVRAADTVINFFISQPFS
ncbi:hypothetical protein HYPDE_28018 [Hyphomicrobium denitrificans 1NES1]|uniref:Uncharacterized protein n=1 Tax=Hyphomicrobium denitrificans 1NES1 TaxID=670307 RepID=N0B2R6_9HYPH|nr:hypothetical protein HYPDE_28018 [Hyphomicrobium denitrificans 1NES1]